MSNPNTNVHGLGAAGPRKNPKDDGNEMFSQGGAQSGTGVLRPTKRTGDAHADLENAARAQSERQHPNAADTGLVVYLYKNGFLIKEASEEKGKFYDTSDPKNVAAQEDLIQGVATPEIEEYCRTRGIRADAVKVRLDKSNIDKQYFDFSMKGNRMDAGGAARGTSFKDATEAKYEPTGDAADTLIQLVLPGGKRARLTVKVNATILDIYRHVMAVTKKDKFDLRARAGMGWKTLENPSETVEEAGLKHGQVQVSC